MYPAHNLNGYHLFATLGFIYPPQPFFKFPRVFLPIFTFSQHKDAF